MDFNEMDTFTIKYPNGNIYTGAVKIRIILNKTEKIRDGFGCMKYKDGTKFEGEYVNDKITGYGIYSAKDGRKIYEGYWKDGKREGIGIYFCEDGASYEGEWKENLKHGIGVYKFNDNSRYLGEFKDDVRNGLGIIHGGNADKYEGEWMNDQGNGFGVYYYNKGDIYVGNWKNGLRDGYGTLTTQDGNEKRGIWEEGELVDAVDENNHRINTKDNKKKTGLLQIKIKLWKVFWIKRKKKTKRLKI